MRSLPRNARGVATPADGSWSRIVAGCFLAAGLLLGASAPSIATDAQVKVSKSAASLPGPLYSWFPAPKVLPAESDARVLDAKFRGQLQAAFDKALQAKGYRPAGPGARADFVLAYRVGVRDVTQTTVRDSEPSSAPQFATRCSAEGCSQIVKSGDNGVPELQLDSVTSVEGGLLVEVLEPGTVRVLWRALSQGTVKPGTISQARLDAVAKSTLAQLPAAGR